MDARATPPGILIDSVWCFCCKTPRWFRCAGLSGKPGDQADSGWSAVLPGNIISPLNAYIFTFSSWMIKAWQKCPDYLAFKVIQSNEYGLYHMGVVGHTALWYYWFRSFGCIFQRVLSVSFPWEGEGKLLFFTRHLESDWLFLIAMDPKNTKRGRG